MRYVFPIPRELRGALLDYPRLYAFPVEPEPPPDDGFVILDSGAYGLAKSGRRMDDEYIAQLARHYQRYAGDRMLPVAPDEYLNPRRTMDNFMSWRGVPVVAVIQFSRSKHVDMYMALKQAQLYGENLNKLVRLYDRPVVAVSNPALRAHEIAPRVCQQVCAIIRHHVPNAWIHMLGAGWDEYDVCAWRDLECFDSMDSIAYYEAARSGKIWFMSDRTLPDWRAIAVHNARHITDFVLRPKR